MLNKSMQPSTKKKQKNSKKYTSEITSMKFFYIKTTIESNKKTFSYFHHTQRYFEKALNKDIY